MKAEEVELLISKKDDKAIENKATSSSTEEMQSLKDDETFAKLEVDGISNHGYSVLSLLLVSINLYLVSRNPLSHRDPLFGFFQIVVYRRRQMSRSGGSKQVTQTLYELD